MVARTAEPPIAKAAEKIVAAQTPAAQPASPEESRSVEHLRLIQVLNRRIGARAKDLARADSRAEQAKDVAKGLKAELQALYDDLREAIEDPYKGMELFKRAAERGPASFFIVSLFGGGKCIATYKTKANWPNEAREFCEAKHAGKYDRSEIREFVSGDEGLSLPELDATRDPAWRKCPIADLKLAGGIAARLAPPIKTAEDLTRAYLKGEIDEAATEDVRKCLERFKRDVSPAQRNDYVAFVASIEDAAPANTPTDADKQPVRRPRITDLDREIADGVREAEQGHTLNRVQFVRERFAAWSPEERLNGMAQALTDEGLQTWSDTSLTEIELSDEIHGKLDKLEITTVGDLLNAIADGDLLTKMTGINKAKATTISEVLRADWDNLIENRSDLAIVGSENHVEAKAPQAAAS